MLKREEPLNCLFKRLCAAIIALFLAPSISAQSYTRNDSTQIYKWLDKSDQEALTGSLDTSINYARIALQISKEKKMLRGEGFAKLKIADIMSQQGSKEDFTGFFAEGLRIGAVLKDSFMMALACYQHGQHLMYNNQLEAAVKLFNRSLLLKFEKEQSSYTGLVYNDMGYLFGLKDELENQTTWLLKAIEILGKAEDVIGLATAYNNLGSVYYKLGNQSKALDYTRNAIALREKAQDLQGLTTSYKNLSFYFGASSSPDSAAKYQLLGLKYAEKTGIKSMIIGSYDNMSVTMSNQNNKSEALAYIKKSIALCREFNNNAGLADKCRWAALLCADLKDTAGMEAFTQEAYDISIKLNNKALLRDLYMSKASNYIKFNDYKSAYDNLKKHYLYRDSIVSEKTITNIAELQTKYETEKKDNEISKLTTAQKIKQLEIEKQKAVIAGNKVAALQKQNEIDLLSKSRELGDIKIKQQEEELEKQLLVAKTNARQLEWTEKENLLRQKELKNQRLVRNLLIGGLGLFLLLGFTYFNRYQLKKKLEAQAGLLTMRNNISQDLHDDIGASLSNINILNELARRNITRPEKSEEYISKASEDIQRISESLSDIVWNINPRYDDPENLFVRMKRYAADMLDGKNIKGEFDFPLSESHLTLSMTQRRDLYLIFKEAVNNLVKYSGAKNAAVKVTAEDHKIELIVKDDGKGFDRSKAGTGNGLHNMEQRAKASGAKIFIASDAGMGTTVKLEMKIS
jgi:two-component system, NarL family, sensor histidine kinase UhpB